MKSHRYPTGIATALFAAALVGAAPVARADDAPSASAPTWSEHVAPIVFDNCVGCHRPGEIGPFSLLSYRDARPWAKSIREAVANRSMPPWHADSSKVEYRNDRSLAQDQIDAIVAWVDAGAPMGDPAAAPPSPEIASDWVMGDPDMIFHATRRMTLPANATDREIGYQYFIFDTSQLTEDLYIRGWEIRDQETGLIHHANLVMGPQPFEEGSENIFAKVAVPGGDYVGSYIPGCRPMMYPEGTAYKLPAGYHMAIQVHYIGKEHEAVASPMFGIRLAEGRIDKRVRVVGLINVDNDLNIPPNEPDYKLGAEADLLFDTLILSSGAHMHLRGWSFNQTAILPDGAEQLVTDVPRYDFNWQSTYWRKEPLFAPKGSRIRSIAHYNNTSANPNVDDPDATVTRGSWTEDEMLNAWSHCVLADENLGLDVKNGRVVGKFPDAQQKGHPMLLQKITSRIITNNGEMIEQAMVEGIRPGEEGLETATP
jgi:mono/diheme cytochrome c family protein